jgi:hypothetical protein
MADPNHIVPAILREIGLKELTLSEFFNAPGISFGTVYNQATADEADYQDALMFLYERSATASGFHLLWHRDDLVHVMLK